MQNVIDHILTKILERSAIQGHTLTGNFEKNLSGRIEETPEMLSIIITDGAGFGQYFDQYLPAEKIPFSPGSGKKHSKFIDGLKRYAELRFGLSDKQALGAAFAMAYTMKEEGKSTKGSYKYSKNGKRSGVITDTLEDEKDTILDLISKNISSEIKVNVNNLITKTAAQWR